MTERIPEREPQVSGDLPSTVLTGEPATATLAVLAELEMSLQASQEALLALNIGGIEHATEEQARLGDSLRISLASTPQRFGDIHSRPNLAVEVSAAAKRVLELTRIQAALLDRARRFLVVLANLVAGGNYAPPVLHRAASTPPAS